MRSPRLAPLPVLALALLACSPPPSSAPRAPAAPPPAESPATLRVTTIPILFEAGGKRLPVPLARVLVNGVETLLIVDTGASHNVITSQFAAAHALPVAATVESGTGHANDVLSARPITAVELSVGTVNRTLSDAMTTAGPPIFEQLGIGGFLSPQNFFEGTTVLDLSRREITVLEGRREAIDAWIAQAYPGKLPQSLARKPGPEPRKIFVDASLEGKPAVLAEVDTGGSSTEFLGSYAGDSSSGAATSSGISVTGADVMSRTVKDRTVVVGGLRFGPMAIETRDKMEAYQGLLGVDLLTQVVLVIPHDRAQDLILIRTGR